MKRRSRLDLRAWHQCGRAWMDQDFTGAISPNAVCPALEPGRRCWAEAAGLAGSSACIWLFSSTLKTIVLSGGLT